MTANTGMGSPQTKPMNTPIALIENWVDFVICPEMDTLNLASPHQNTRTSQVTISTRKLSAYGAQGKSG